MIVWRRPFQVLRVAHQPYLYPPAWSVSKFWQKFNGIPGSPPILVLSYKNHAIDEFLKDLIREETGKISLIRIGGSCKDPVLERYAENKQWVYKQVHTHIVIISEVNFLNWQCKFFLDNFRRASKKWPPPISFTDVPSSKVRLDVPASALLLF